jgi:hypothetical protein
LAVANEKLDEINEIDERSDYSMVVSGGYQSFEKEGNFRIRNR